VERLFHDLEIVSRVDRRIGDLLPVLFNYQGQGGYFTMPSARMPQTGWIGFGYSSLPPYNVWNLSFQFFDRVEAVGTYWIYREIIESNFGCLGYGDDAERSANLKLCLLRPQDGVAFLPTFSVGWNDFFGSCRFHSFYTVATQEILRCNLEATLGWGSGRIHGFFGGAAWTPWRQSSSFLKGLSLAVEYDANNYRRHAAEHPKGRTVRSRWNAGAHYELGRCLYASASSVRGADWGASLSWRYNLGGSKGLLAKSRDAPTYRAPVDTEPAGRLRSGGEMARDMAYAFQEQGLDLYAAYLVPSTGGTDSLHLRVVNMRYRRESDVRERLIHILSRLSPSNVANVTAAVESDGVVVHQYCFRLVDLARYRQGCLGDNEFLVIAPLREAENIPSTFDGTCLYQRRRWICTWTLRPRALTFFGSSSGKFKGQLGASLGPEGYLFGRFYYNVQVSLTAFSMLQNLSSWDALNPSKLLNVRTDSLLYHQAGSFHVDVAHLQKSWNLGSGWFTRLAAGYFETAYGGLAGEALYYPVSCNWAVGLEAATVWKRRYHGVGFTHKIRKLSPEGPIWVPYVGFQCFVNMYYDYKPLNLDFKIGIGQFLARDKGVRFDSGRTFSSGLRVGLWYTITNAKDVVNHQRYYDKGFSITLPLDFFMNQSSRTRTGFAMSAWLRDCGAKACTGKELHHTIYFERFG
jgi:hypothetical protein